MQFSALTAKNSDILVRRHFATKKMQPPKQLVCIAANNINLHNVPQKRLKRITNVQIALQAKFIPSKATLEIILPLVRLVHCIKKKLNVSNRTLATSRAYSSHIQKTNMLPRRCKCYQVITMQPCIQSNKYDVTPSTCSLWPTS